MFGFILGFFWGLFGFLKAPISEWDDQHEETTGQRNSY
ncbi:hypothetical protein REIFOR_03073 [Reinekea forsetii]|uniref:Uncharacterized protein n=1 Tax=Reinekea forsetii TaxID=1336806 RepID=A0A2K8KUA3_9GAMM|nr:hypothetical protein REIFOR_03073 [Reinekea forsetii]